MATNIDIFEPIWKTSSPGFRDRIPAPSQANWSRIGQLIASDNYEAERNEIFNALINVIGKTKVWNMSITNRLASHKSGTMTYGDTYQEIMSDVIEAQTFAIAEDDQFKKWPNTVFAAYHRINREDFYPVTIEETKIIRAFQRENGLQSLINNLVNQMYSSNDLDEFILTKRLMREYYMNSEVPVITTQILKVPDPRVNAASSSRVRAFVMAVKGAIKEMSFPKRSFNPMGIMMQTQPSNFELFLDASVTIIQEVNTLTGAFHPQYMNINLPITDIDDFGDDMEDIIGIIADKEWLKIFDTLRRLKTADNARNLYRNYYYHVHQLYSASPFCNVIFLKADPTWSTP